MFKRRGVQETPDDFFYYMRNANHLHPLIEEATRQHQRFSEFGLTSMAAEIKSQLSKLIRNFKDDSYYGFNRITMTNASIILSKMHNATFSNQPLIKPSVKMDSCPASMDNLVKKLDKWPEALDKPIFDNLWVMVYGVINVILGDKDGKVYFISYWM